MRPTPRSAAFCFLLAAVGACAEAGGELKGGEMTDAGEGATTPPQPPPVETPEAKPVPSKCDGTGTRWTDLYNDIFGPTGKPGSCSFQSNCHGSADGAGARSLSGIQCFDARGCRQSMLDKNLVTAADATDPDESNLLKGLVRRRRPDGRVTGFMPLLPLNHVFDEETCIERMKTWIRDGAKDD